MSNQEFFLEGYGDSENLSVEQQTELAFFNLMVAAVRANFGPPRTPDGYTRMFSYLTRLWAKERGKRFFQE